MIKILPNLASRFPAKTCAKMIAFALAFGLSIHPVMATVTITTATGGTNISADKAANATSPAWTTLGDIIILEGQNGDFTAAITNGTFTLAAPSGWNFNTGVGTVTYTASRDMTALGISVTSTSIVITYTTNNPSNKIDQITISGIQVQATLGGNIPGSGDIIFSAASNSIAGITLGTTSAGSLSQTFGSASKLAFTTQPSNGSPGVNLPTQPAVTVQDQFGTTVTTASNSITLAIGTNPGSGTLTVDTNPLSATSGVATFSGVKINNVGTGYTLTASAGGLTGATSSTFNISVSNTITTGTVSGSPFCAGASSINVPFNYSPSANFGAGTTIFKAQLSNSSGSFASPVDLQTVTSNASGSQSISATIPAGTTTGTGYRIRVVSDSPAVNGSDNGSNLSVNALPTNSLTVGGTTSLCSGSGTNITVALSESGVNYQLRNNADNSAVGSAVAGTGGTINLPTGNLSATTTYNVLATNATSSCSAQLTSTATVTVNAVPGISSHPSTGTQSLCLNATPTDLSITASAGSGSISSYKWYSNTSASNSGGTLVATHTSSSTSDTYTPLTSSAGTLYYYCVVTNSNTCTTTSNVTGAITVNSLPTTSLTVGGTGSLCTGSSTNITVALSESGVNYQLRNNADNSSVGSPVAGTGGTINLPTGSLSSTTTFNVLATVASSSCSAQLSSTATITVNALPTVTLGANPLVCGGTTSANLPYLATTGSPDKYSIVWDATAITAGFSNVTDASLTSSPIAITVPSGAAAAVYNGTLSVKKNSTGCSSTGTAITVTVSRVSITPTVTQPTCYSDGSITLSISGGTAPYTYDWADVSGTSNPRDRAGLAAGSYTVTVTDANGCTATSGAHVLTAASGCTGLTVCQSDAGTVFSVDPNPANTTYTWSITKTTSGDYTAYITSGTGTPSITVNWTAHGIYPVAPVGAYTISVYGSNASCDNSTPSTVTVYVQAPTAYASADAACAGGAINLHASGGTTYSWTGPNSFTSQSANPVIYNASSGTHNGTYTVTVTDSDGCSATASVVVAVNAVPSITASSVTNATCGNSTGSIALTTDGTSFSWSNGATTEDISGVAAGNYTVTVYNAAGCSTQATYAVLNSDGPTATITSSTNIGCNGGSTGSINLTVGGGSGYTYVWTASNGGVIPSGQGTVEDPSGLVAGTYSVDVTSGGCHAYASVTLTQPNALQAEATTTNIKCFGASTGAINLSVSGGTPGYTYAWTGPSSFTSTSQNISSLAAGTYNVTISDAVLPTACTLSLSYTLTQPSAALTATPTATNISCNGGSNGQIVLAVSGGTSPYTFNWTASGGGVVPVGQSHNQNLTGLVAGTYSVTVTDATSVCTFSLTGGTAVTITQPAILDATVTKTNIGCFGANDGSVVLTSPSGGYGTYQYKLGTGAWQSSGSYTGLSAGTYTLKMRDAANPTCEKSFSDQTVTEPTVLSATVGKTNITCNNLNNGTITVSSPAGGYGTYEYQLNTGTWQSSGSFTSLSAGTYSVNIRDAANSTCYVALGSQTVTNPSVISITASLTNILCNGASTGAINITATGGTGTLTYAWTGPSGYTSTSEDLTSRPAGTYTVTVTDGNSCTGTASYTLTQPSALSASSTKTDISCNANSDGSINLSVSGGASPYTYAWTGPSSYTAATQDISGLSDGTYNVTVTDANGCTATDSKTISRPTAFSRTAVATNTSCYGGSNGSINLTASGGTGTLSYLWSNGSTSEDPTGLSAQTYTVTITDANGCTTSTSATVGQPTQMSISSAVTDVSCYGGSTGAINITVTGGTGPYASYAWTGPSSYTAVTEDITGLATGTYTVTVTDANTCTRSATITVGTPSALGVTVEAFARTCLSANGTVIATVSGGTAPYTYSWTKNPSATVIGTTANISSLDAGTYSVTVTDARSCTAIASGIVTTPSCSTPVAVSDSYVTAYNTQIVNATVASNDSDSQYSVLSFMQLTSPLATQGTVAWDPSNNGTFTFTPYPGYTGTFTFTYRVTNPTGLFAGPVTVTIQVVAPPTTATNASTQAMCISGAGTATLAGNTPVSGTGAWSVISGPSTASSQFSSVSNPTATFTPAGGIGQYTVRWTISNAPNPASSADATISVEALPTISLSSASGTNTQAVCLNSAITNITYAIGGGAYDATVTGLPAGVTGSYASGVFTISGSPTASAGSPYSYTVTTTTGLACSPVTAIGTITVNPLPTPVISGSTTTCASSASNTYSTSSISGHTYAWTISGGTIVGSTTGNSVNVTWGSGASGWVKVTETITATGCSYTTAQYDVTLTAVPGTPVVGTITQPDCTTPTGSVVLSNLPATSWTINPGGITGSTTSKTVTGLAPGTYNFTVTSSATGCTSAASADVVINTPAGATSDLVVTKSASSNTPNVGSNVTFTITAGNNGPCGASGVSLTESLPAGYTLVSATPSAGTWSSPTWSIGTMSNGATATLSVVATVNATGSYANTVTITGDQTDPTPGNNTVTNTPVPVPQTNLVVTKTVDNSTPNVGSNVTFTVTASNSGPSAATGVSVSDALPAGYTLVSATPSTGTWSAPTWTIGSMANGASATLTVVATVNATGSYANTASITGDQNDPTPGNNSVTNTPVPVPQTNLAVTKTADNATPNVGSNVTFTITATNNGPSAATGVSVSDALPAGYTFVSATPSTGSWSAPNWTIGSMANGASATLTVVATVKATGSYANTAAITGDQNDPTPGNNSVTNTPVPVPQTNLAVTKTVDNSTPNVGSDVTFTITATNNGPSAATGVAVSDALPSGYTFVSATPSTGTWSAPTWTIGSMANGASATLTVVATVKATGAYDNTATITGDQADPTPGNNSVTNTPVPVPITNLSITKTVDNATPGTGSTVTFTITAANSGPSTATGVSVSDALPSGYTFVSATPSTGSWSAPTWTIGTMNNGASATLTLVATVKATGTYANTATISGDQTDPTPGNNTATSTPTVSNAADVYISKTITTSPVVAGSRVQYTLVIGNNGPATATNVTVADVNTWLSNIEYSTNGTTWSTFTGTFNEGTMASGAMTISYIRGTLLSSKTGTLSNTASVSSDMTDNTSGNNSDTETAAITTSADLHIDVTCTSAPLQRNTTGNYTVVVHNSGPSDALSVVISDAFNATYVTSPQYSTDGGSTWNTWTGSLNIGTLASNADYTLLLRGNVTNDATDPLSNTASVSSSTPDPVSANNSATINTPMNVSADLSITLTGPASVTAGTQINYTLTATNNSATYNATGVVIEDIIDASYITGAEYSTDNGTTWNTWTGTYNVGTLNTSTTVTVLIRGNVPSGVVTNVPGSANISSSTPDPTSANNSSSITTPIATSADMWVTKTLTSATVVAGSQIAWDITVKNLGPSNAAAAVVTDILPSGLTNPQYSDDGGTTWTAWPGTNTFALGSVPYNVTLVLKVRATVNLTNGGPISNTASVSATTTDAVSGNNSSTAGPTTVLDQTNPTIVCPAPVSVSCASAVPAVDLTAPVTSDNISAVTVTHRSDVISSQTCANRYTLTRTYRATDASGNWSECSQVITVADNTVPVITCIADLSRSTGTSSLTYAASGTEFNPSAATDNCGTPSLSYVLTGATTGSGNTTLAGVTFNPGFTLVTWTATDACGNTAGCSFNVTVTRPDAVNVAPVAVNDTKTTNEDSPTTINVVANDTDSDGTINVATVDLDPATAGIQSSFTDANGNVWSVNSSGVVTFTPALNFNGSASINYTVNDNTGATSNIGVISITVTPVNDTPVALNDNAGASLNTPVTTDVLANDYDVDGNLSPSTVSIVTAPLHGTTSINPVTGAITYTPNTGYFGTDSYIYRVCDTNAACAEATVSIQIPPIAPVAVNDVVTTNEDTPVTIDVVANDYDPQGNFNYGSVTIVTGPDHGTVSVNPTTGVVTFTPSANYNGTDQFTYQVCDLTAYCSVALVNLTIVAVNDPPAAINDVASVNEDGTLSGSNLLANDTDPEGNTLTINTTPVSGPSHGTLVINANGTYTYTPTANYNGTDTFTYQVCDNGTPSLCSTATVTITINAVNDAPVAVNDTKSTVLNVATTINVVSNDTDVDGTIDAATVDLDPSTPGIQSSYTDASGNTWTVNSSGVVSFTPALNFSGTASISYTVNDNSGATSNSGTISVSVASTIAANDDNVSSSPVNGYTGNSSVVNVLTNDVLNSAAVNLTLVNLTAVSDPSDGVTLNTGTGVVSVAAGTPAGTYTITYQICQVSNPTNCDQGTVTVYVAPAPLVANDGTYGPVNGVAGSSNAGSILTNTTLNGTTADIAKISITVLTAATPVNVGDPVPALNPLTGTISVPANTPAGTYTITYRVCELLNPSNCDDAIATIVIAPSADLSITKVCNTSPVVAGQTVQYTLTVSNAGPNSASDVVITDAVPAAITGAQYSLNAGSTWTDWTGTYTHGTMAASGSVSILIRGTVASSTANNSSLANTASVASSTADPSSSGNSATSTSTVTTSANVAILKTAGTVVAGARVTYTLTAFNAGPSDAAAVTFTDALTTPPFNAGTFEYSTNSGTSWSAWTGSYNAGTLIANRSVGILVRATLNSAYTGATIANTATVSSTTSDPSSSNNSSSITSPVTWSADLWAVKTCNTSPVYAGQPVEYAITVTNNGSSDATGVVVTDNINASYLSGAQYSTDNRATWTTWTGTLTLGTLASGSTTVVLIKANVLANVTTSIPNTASVTSPVSDPDNTNNNSAINTTVTGSADLSIVKTCNTATPSAGQTIQYTLAVTNAGPSDAQSVTITDNVSTSITGVQYSTNNGSSWQTWTGSYTNGTLAMGGSLSILIRGTVSSSVLHGTVISNTATVSSPTFDPSSGNGSSTVTSTINALANLSISKTGSPHPVAGGEVITYTIGVMNTGPGDAQSVLVTDAVSANILTPQYSVNGGTTWLTWSGSYTIGTVAANATASLLIRGTVKPSITDGSSLTNTASVSSPTADPDSGNNTATDAAPVSNKANLSISKRGTPHPVAAGQVITYTLVATNAGPSDATNVVIADPMPTGINNPEFSINGGLTWNPWVNPYTYGTLAASGTATILIRGKVGTDVANGTLLRNTAAISSATADPLPGSNFDTDEATVATTADLSITKVSTPNPVIAGHVVTYTIAVSNTGYSDAQGVQITDAVSAAIQNPEFTVDNGNSWRPWVSPYTAGTVRANSTFSLMIRGTVAPDLSRGTALNNTASVGSSTYDPSTGNNTVTDHNEITVPHPNLLVTKMAIDSVYSAVGDILRYKIIVYNNSGDNLYNITVSDTNAIITSGSPIPRLNAWQSADVFASHIVTQADIDSGEVNNTVTAVGINVNAKGVSDKSNLVKAKGTQRPQITITKFAAETRFKSVGEIIHYTLEVFNCGNVTLSKIVVTDPNATIVGSSTVSSLIPRATVTLNAIHRVTQADIDAGKIANIAYVEGFDPTNKSVKDDSNVVTLFNNQPDHLSVVMLAQETSFKSIGDTIHYEMTLKNYRSTYLSNVYVFDANAVITTTIPIFRIETEKTATVKAYHVITQKDLDTGKVVNSAIARGTDYYGYVDQVNSNEVTVFAKQDPMLQLVKTAQESSFENVGDLIHYNNVITNNGNIRITGIELNDPNTHYSGSNKIAGLNPGESITIQTAHTVTQTDINVGSVEKTASLTAVDANSQPIRVLSNPLIVKGVQNADLSAFLIAAENTFRNTGEVIHYTVNIRNNGNITLTKLEISAPGATFPNGTAIMDLLPGNTAMFTAEHTVTPADVAAGQLTGRATLTGYKPDGSQIIRNTNEILLEAGLVPGLSVTTVSQESSFRTAGEVIHYNITIRNSGNTPLNNILITDPNAQITGSPVVNLSAFGTVIVTANHTVIQSDLDAGMISNTVTISGQHPDGTAIDRTGNPVTIYAIAEPKLTAKIYPSETSYKMAGDTITYAIEVKNNGNLTVSDLSLTTLGDITLSGAGAGAGIAVDKLAPGESARWTGIYLVTWADMDAGKIVRSVNAFGQDPHQQPVSTASNQTSITGIQMPELTAVAAPVSATFSEVGEVISYHIEVKNSGNVSLISTAVTDPNAVIISVRPNVILMPGESFPVTATHIVTQADMDAGKVVTVAKAEGFDLAGHTIGKPANQVTVYGLQRKEIGIDATASSNYFEKVGDVINYEIRVKNAGNISIFNLEVLDANAIMISTNTKPSLIPGDDLAIAATHIVTQADLDAGEIVNLVMASGFDLNGNPITKTGEKMTINGIQHQDLAVTTATSVPTYQKAGDRIQYTVVIRNTGNVTMKDISVTDAKALLDFKKTLPALAPGEADSLTAQHEVTVEDLNAGRIITAGIATGYSNSRKFSFLGNETEVFLLMENFNLGNYPNPFAYKTTIVFDIPERGEVTLKVFDVTGRLVGILEQKEYGAGRNYVYWRTRNEQKGTYILKMYYQGQTAVKQIEIIN